MIISDLQLFFEVYLTFVFRLLYVCPVTDETAPTEIGKRVEVTARTKPKGGPQEMVSEKRV